MTGRPKKGVCRNDKDSLPLNKGLCRPNTDILASRAVRRQVMALAKVLLGYMVLVVSSLGA